MDIIRCIGTTRANLSITHLLAAAKFSRAVGELERLHANEPLSAFWDDIQSYAIGSVLTAAAGLEAYANESFKDTSALFENTDQADIANIWECYERKPILGKFGFLLHKLDRPALASGKSPGQDVIALVELRNGLIHFKPEWADDQVDHKRISEEIKYRVVHSPFQPTTEPLFPKAWPSHGTTKWAVKSVVSLMSTFANAAGAKNPVDLFADRLRSD